MIHGGTGILGGCVKGQAAVLGARIVGEVGDDPYRYTDAKARATAERVVLGGAWWLAAAVELSADRPLALDIHEGVICRRVVRPECAKGDCDIYQNPVRRRHFRRA